MLTPNAATLDLDLEGLFFSDTYPPAFSAPRRAIPAVIFFL